MDTFQNYGDNDILEYFTKFPVKFYSEEWFGKPNYVAVFMHLLSKVNWRDTITLYKGERCIVCKGEAIITLRQLSKDSGVPLATVQRIIDYFEKRYTIEKRNANVFSLISITYLMTEYTDETETVHKRYTRNPKLNKLRDLLRPKIIDNKIINNKNKINFVEDIFFIEQKEKHMLSDNKKNLVETATSVFRDKQKDSKARKDSSFLDRLLEVWSEEYKTARGIEYVQVKGRDNKGIASIIGVLKKENNNLDTEEMIECFRNWLRKVFSIKDSFFQENCHPVFIFSQMNKINLRLKNNSLGTISSVGQANQTADYSLKLK
jgi:hypothetical protein